MALGVQFGTGHFTGLDNTGEVVPYGKIYFTDPFTGEPILTYKNSALTVVNANPVVLSASGKAEIFLAANTYNIVLTDADDQTIWSMEGFVTVGLGEDLSAWRERQTAAALQTDFVFTNPVSSGTLVFVNGSLKEEGVGEDYIVVPPYTIKFNAGLALDDEVVGFGAAPTVTTSGILADGTVPMDPSYVPAIPQDIATKASSETYTDAAEAAQALINAKKVSTDPTGITGGNAVPNVIWISSANFAAITTPSDAILYILKD